MTNSLLLHVQRYEWNYGVLAWGIYLIVRCVELSGIFFIRWRVGKSSHGLLSILVCFCLLSIVAVSNSFTANYGRIREFDNCVYISTVVGKCMINPVYLMQTSPVLGSFNLLVLFLALGNKALEQALPLNMKPGLKHRGDSIVLTLAERFIISKAGRMNTLPFTAIQTIAHYGSKGDFKNLYLRLGQPLLLGLYGYLILSNCNSWSWTQDWQTIGVLLIMSACVIFWRDHQVFASGRRTR